MKGKLILFLGCLLCFSCNTSKRTSDRARVFGPVMISRDSISGYNPDDKQALSYKFIVDTSGYLLKSILIYSNGKPLQVIEANKEIERIDFHLVDWNFDGYKDISVLYNCGTGGCAYWIWNYSPAENEYYFNDDLSEKLGLEIDTTSRYIIFHYRGGWSNEYWDTSQYIGNQLTFVKGLYRERGNDTLGNIHVKDTYRKMQDGKLIEYSDSYVIKQE